MRLNTEPYEINYNSECEEWRITGPGIVDYHARDSRFSAEQLGQAMAIAFKAGIEKEKHDKRQIEFDEADW
jgi:hypothetical protein